MREIKSLNDLKTKIKRIERKESYGIQGEGEREQENEKEIMYFS